jgi:hypothetical protein
MRPINRHTFETSAVCTVAYVSVFVCSLGAALDVNVIAALSKRHYCCVRRGV